MSETLDRRRARNGDRALTHRADAAPARRHFTRLDQVTQLVGASAADAELGFMARLLALCSLPRTNPGNRDKYVRRNGPYTLYMTATGSAKLPFGNIPRLLLAWVTTEAVQTQSRVLVLDDSLSAFMRRLELPASGSTHTRLRNQMDRLFKATVTLTYEDERSHRYMTSPIADRGELWWDPKRPADRTLWNNTIRWARSSSTRSSATRSRSTCTS